MATYLVTGASRGFGYEYCHQLQARGDSAIAVYPESSVKLKTLKIRREGTSTAAVTDLQERLREIPVIEIVTIV